MRLRRGSAVLALGLALAPAALGGCSKNVPGSGRGATDVTVAISALPSNDTAATGSAAPAASASTSGSPSSSVGGSASRPATGSASGSAPASGAGTGTAAAPGGALPPAVPPPTSCSPLSQCPKAASGDVGDGYTLVLRSGPGSGSGASVLELRYRGVSVFWTVKDDETPYELACSATPQKRCVVVDYTGAHAAVGRLWKVMGNTLVAGGTATSDTPGMHATDLNKDGYVDVVALQNDYTPDYATGKVYWQTWVSNGQSLVSTGCSAKASGDLPPQPVTPQTGSCG